MQCSTVKKIGAWFLALGLVAIHVLCRSTLHAAETSTTAPMQTDAWKAFRAKSGDCTIAFPSQPTLVQQSLQLSESKQKLYYDIYLAPFGSQGVFMLLIATYPNPLAGGHEIAGLEGLLKGIVGHHPDNQLIFADLLQYAEHPALTFLVQSTANYFRGQAFMVGNKLYLIAMEGKKSSLNEEMFKKFLESFQLLNPGS